MNSNYIYQIGDCCKLTSINIDYGKVTIVDFAGTGKICGSEVNIYICKLSDGSFKQVSETLLELA